jgi:predicted glycosyltransferase
MSSSKASPPLTILFQPPNHIGMGHINRLSAIALAVREAAPEAQVPFVLSGSSHSLLESLEIPCIPLPDVHALWSVESPLIASLVGTILDRLKPHVVVFDCFPLRPLAYAAIARGIPIVLCLREMKDTGRYFAEYGLPENAIRTIIVPHLPREMGLPEGLRRKVIFVGTILRRARIHPALIPEEGRPHVVICGGGGGNPGTPKFYDLVLQAITGARASRRLDATLIAGPLFQGWTRLKLIDGLRVIPFEPNLPSLLATADLVICQAGYNTLAEVTALGLTTICMPVDNTFDDQFARARELSELTPNFEVFSNSDPGELAKLMIACLDRPSYKRVTDEISSPGAALAANAILEAAREAAKTSQRFRIFRPARSNAFGPKRFAGDDEGPALVRMVRRAYRQAVPLDARLRLHLRLLRLIRRDPGL